MIFIDYVSIIILLINIIIKSIIKSRDKIVFFNLKFI